MTLVKLNNRPVLNMDHLFNDLFNDAFFSGNRKQESFVPAVNIHETTDAYHLELNAPGREKADFAIQLVDGLLTIAYEQKEEAVREDYNTLRREFGFRGFKRSFHVDEQIDGDAIQARYEQGILRLLLPKKPEVKPASKNISIQ